MRGELPNQHVQPFSFRERTARGIFIATICAVALSVCSAFLGVEWPGPWSSEPQSAATDAVRVGDMF